MLIENQLDKLMYSMENGVDDAATMLTNGCHADGCYNEDDAQQEALLQQLQAIDVDVADATALPTCMERLCNAWKGLPFKAALSHAGLMFSLLMYCGIGGLVCWHNVGLYTCFMCHDRRAFELPRR